ncbi:MAG: hypothetical protein Kow0025_15370 [Thermodesulfovibrionales bacterium]
MRNRVFGAIFLVLGGLVALTPRYILPVCEYYGKPAMDCSYTAGAEYFAGFIIIAIGIGTLLSKGSEALRWLMLVALVAAVSVVAIPEVMGFCPNPRMYCNYGTVPMLRFLGGLGIVSSAVGFGLSLRPG